MAVYGSEQITDNTNLVAVYGSEQITDNTNLVAVYGSEQITDNTISRVGEKNKGKEMPNLYSILVVQKFYARISLCDSLVLANRRSNAGLWEPETALLDLLGVFTVL